MVEEIPKKISIPDLAVGIAIGFIIGYAIAKETISGTTSIGPTNSNSNSNLNSLSQLSQLNIGIRQLSNRLAIIEAKLGIPPSPEVPLSDSSSLNSPPSNMKQIMENEETFDIKKDEKGRMTGFTNHRKLFETGSD